MGALSRDEAQAIAAQLVEDLATAGDPGEALTIYDALDNQDDLVAVGRYLIEPLLEAIEAFKAGDRSQRTLNLVAVAGTLRRGVQH